MGTTPSQRPSYFSEPLADPPRVIRLDARHGNELDSLPSDRLGLRDVYVIENAVGEGFASTWFTRLLAESGGKLVKYWHQRSYFEGETTLRSIVRRIYLASSHRSAVMMMDENILRRATLLEDLQAELPEALQPHRDLFQQWPAPMQPAKQCLIMGGTGGCSTLHTDMLGWTGWNVLLMGRKHWKFFPPAPEVGEALDAEVREMGDQYNLGFSCTSPVDMFHSANGLKCPERAPDPRFCKVEFTADAERYPRAAQVCPLLEVVQGPDELIVFPAHYFHQTYHYEPTIAVASQMMNEGCKARVLGQILDFAGADRRALPPDLWSRPVPEQMKTVLGIALDRMWPGNGRAYLERMWSGVPPHRPHHCRTAAAGRVSGEGGGGGAAGERLPPLGQLALQLACGMLDVPPWEAEGTLPVAWAMPLAGRTW